MNWNVCVYVVLSEQKLFRLFLMIYINQDKYDLKREG